jgi:hypothetical protein
MLMPRIFSVTIRDRLCFLPNTKPTMKALPALAFLAALGAFFLLPINPGLAGSILFLAAVAPIATADCDRGRRIDLKVGATSGSLRRERFGLAA